MLKFLHILISLLYLPQVLSDNIFRPSAGELIPGNATYPVNWNITEYAGAGNTRIDGIYLAIPNMTPPYTSTFPVQAPNYITMTTTGYINMVFTEINPTSTTTTILLVYEPNCCIAKTFTLGPYTVLRHDTTPSTPTPPVTQPPAQGAQPTQTVVSAETVTPSSGITSLSPALPSPSICESLLAVFLVVFWHFISLPEFLLPSKL